MNTVCIDSNFVIAVSNPLDCLHSEAVAASKLVANNKHLISNLIFSEFSTVISQKMGRPSAITTGNKLLNSSLTKFVLIDHPLFISSWEIFSQLKRKNISFVDCSILAVMRRFKIKHLLSFDHADFAPLQKEFGFKLINTH